MSTESSPSFLIAIIENNNTRGTQLFSSHAKALEYLESLKVDPLPVQLGEELTQKLDLKTFKVSLSDNKTIHVEFKRLCVNFLMKIEIGSNSIKIQENIGSSDGSWNLLPRDTSTVVSYILTQVTKFDLTQFIQRYCLNVHHSDITRFDDKIAYVHRNGRIWKLEFKEEITHLELSDPQSLVRTFHGPRLNSMLAEAIAQIDFLGKVINKTA